MEYQGRTLVPVGDIIRNRSVLNSLEKMAGPEKEVMIDVKFTHYKFKAGRGPDFQKYNLYTVKRAGESENLRFLTSVDRLVKNGKKTSRYRIN